MNRITKLISVGIVGLLGFTFTTSAQEEASQEAVIEATKMVAPTLPQEFNLGQVEVNVLFNLNYRGEPVNIRVTDSPTFSYAKSAKRAVKQWRFDVAENADLSNTDIQLPVVFHYSD